MCIRDRCRHDRCLGSWNFLSGRNSGESDDRRCSRWRRWQLREGERRLQKCCGERYGRDMKQFATEFHRVLVLSACGQMPVRSARGRFRAVAAGNGGRRGRCFAGGRCAAQDTSQATRAPRRRGLKRVGDSVWLIVSTFTVFSKFQRRSRGAFRIAARTRRCPIRP